MPHLHRQKYIHRGDIMNYVNTYMIACQLMAIYCKVLKVSSIFVYIMGSIIDLTSYLKSNFSSKKAISSLDEETGSLGQSISLFKTMGINTEKLLTAKAFLEKLIKEFQRFKKSHNSVDNQNVDCCTYG